MVTIAGQSFTELKNRILSEIISNIEIMKALVMHSENFLEVTPTIEEQKKLDEPEKLIRKQIFPYKTINFVNLEADTYITSGFYNFKKIGKSFINGNVSFYVITENSLEKTSYGSRYDVIADKLEEIFSNSGIGEFEFKNRSDIDLPVNNFQCHVVAFEIIDFHWVGV